MEDVTLLIFGASGDLTARKLIPALYQLHCNGFLPERSVIIGVARREKSDDAFRGEMRDAVAEHRAREFTEERWSEFARRLRYVQVNLEDPAEFPRLHDQVEAIEKDAGLPGQRIVYLATAPALFTPSVEALAQANMIPPLDEADRLRVVFEKPFGHDLASAQELSHSLSRVLREKQIYRIDHYLGKETVQNLLLFRFGNSIFEPMFNRNQVDHVQITVAETQGIEGSRGGYYDQSGGALRDVLQNHVLQLLCLVAMEPPASFQAEYIRNEKLKVLQALGPGRSGAVSEWAVAGQYAAAAVNGQRVRAYLDEDRIPPDSRRETFVALEARIDNWRWAGVPFYLRTGKRMPARVTEIAIQFKLPPLNLFSTVECEGTMCDLVEARPNTLVFHIQPRESITLSFSAKRPGMQYQVQPVDMEFNYQQTFDVEMPEAYERLLLDVIRGDSTLFTRSDELEAAWRFCEPMLEAWSSKDHHPELYAAGGWGPKAAHQLLARSGRHWRVPDLPDGGS
ncbi:MAG: glucose-6-phosphate dehydrogenase [Planctomyces sp.]|nr:glucose-6-phosphate dehydrogenase [Planctomyces sp.]